MVEVWSDVICPWCYVGVARFEKALAGFEHRDEVTVTHRAFELDPSTPRGQVSSVLDMLAAKFGGGRDQVLAMESKMQGMAEAEGLGYVADRPTGNTYDAHQLIAEGALSGAADVVRNQLWKAHFAEGRSVFTTADLVTVGTEAGLDPAATEKALTTDAHWESVRKDEQRAAQLGITGVPFFVLGDVTRGEALGISGAQSSERFTVALTKSWSETPPA